MHDSGQFDAIDFSSGVQPLCQWFKSLVVLPETVDGTPDVSDTEHLRSLERWVAEHDTWYRSACGGGSGSRMRLLYYREISTFGALSNLESLCRLSELAHRHGMSFTCTFDAQDLCEGEEAVLRLAARPGFMTAGIRIDRDTPLAMAPSLERTILSIIALGAHVAFVAPVDRLREFRLLDNPTISSVILRVHPTGAPSRSAPPSSCPPAPCSNLFRVHVARSGRLYPCAGLLDVPVACLGSIYRPFSESVFGGRPTDLEIPTLARHGPAPDSRPVPGRRVDLHWQCEGHRAQLLREHGESA